MCQIDFELSKVYAYKLRWIQRTFLASLCYVYLRAERAVIEEDMSGVARGLVSKSVIPPKVDQETGVPYGTTHAQHPLARKSRPFTR